MKEFVVYYVEANFVCAFVFGILLVHNHFNIDRQEKQVKFDRVLMTFIFYFLADSVWAMIVGGLISKTRFVMVSNTFVIYLLMAASTFFWLDYIMAVELVPHRNRPINRFAVIFPFLVSTAALVLHYLIAPGALINEALDTQAGFTVYLVTVPWIYLVAILFYTIRRARGEENRLEKRKHLLIGLMPLTLMLFGVIQLWVPLIPIYCFSAMILMLLFYIQAIEGRISLDPLTRLNNRGQLRRYVSQRANLRLEDRLTVVVMMDINDFKLINDTYGHAEGDNALVVVADLLKSVINRHNMPSFLGRYGGDEFILIIHPGKREEAEELIREIRAELVHIQRKRAIPYALTIGIGFDELMNQPDTIQSCLRRADKKLYLDKENCKRQNRQAGSGGLVHPA